MSPPVLSARVPAGSTSPCSADGCCCCCSCCCCWSNCCLLRIRVRGGHAAAGLSLALAVPPAAHRSSRGGDCISPVPSRGEEPRSAPAATPSAMRGAVASALPPTPPLELPRDTVAAGPTRPPMESAGTSGVPAPPLAPAEAPPHVRGAADRPEPAAPLPASAPSPTSSSPSSSKAPTPPAAPPPYAAPPTGGREGAVVVSCRPLPASGSPGASVVLRAAWLRAASQSRRPHI